MTLFRILDFQCLSSRFFVWLTGDFQGSTQPAPKSNPMALTPQHLANILSEEQLELLAEFADDFEDDDDDDQIENEEEEEEESSADDTPRVFRASQSFASSAVRPKRGGKAALNIILAAQQALRKKNDDAPAFQGHRNEWNSELDLEVDDCDKSQTRLPAVPTREHIPVKGTMCA